MTAAATNPATPTEHHLRAAFARLAWVGWTFDAAMARPRLQHIIKTAAHKHAAHNHYTPMESITPVALIERQAHKAAAQSISLDHAQPYPHGSPAAKAFATFFEAEQKRRQALSMWAQTAINTIAKIETEARLAAAEPAFRDINDACPYPFGTLEANTFKKAFNQARNPHKSNALRWVGE